MRVLGIDPGASIGVAVLDVGPRTADVARLETWHDGDEKVLAVQMDAVLFHLEPEIVSIEKIAEVHGQDRMGSGYAAGLCRGNWLGGLLAGVARAKGYQVVTPRAGDWRRAIVGAERVPDSRVAQAIRLRCPAWPKVSNAHQRDAAGCALWAGLAPRCVRCRKPVEEVRWVYAHPTCFACLPPPKPLPVVKVKKSGSTRRGPGISKAGKGATR